MPVVSVVIATYNHGHYILEAINSILSQTYKDYEIIVVDDGSTDHTRIKLGQFNRLPNFRYIYQDNQGKSVARNKGIKVAVGNYISFLDADDLYVQTKLEQQVEFLDSHPEIGLVHSGYSKFDNDKNDLGYRDTSRFNGWVYPEILLEWSVLMATPCVMVRAEVLMDVGGFDERMLRAQDLDMWRRISMKFKLGVIPQPLSRIRVHPLNRSAYLITKAIPYFEMYLENAFNDDPNLDDKFKRLAKGKLFYNISQNYLARGNRDTMPLVREYCLKAIKLTPYKWQIYLLWMGSWLETGFRQNLLRLWQKVRYQR
jgi:glycosyltransferase involved in cell wall biosynthesis